MAMAVDGLRLVDPAAYAAHGYPHAEWRQLRREAPVARFAPAGWPAYWALTRHAEIVEVSKQPERFVNGLGMTIANDAAELNRESFGQMRTIINMDPPDHRKYRKVASPWFTPRALGRLDALVAQTARALVDGLGREGECDFVAQIASIHPLKVICRILGVPEEDEPFILKLTNELFGAEDPEFQRVADRAANVRALGLDFFNYFSRVMTERRERPRDDLASVIANARIDGAPMGVVETMGYCLITFTAGHETTRGAIGGGMLALLENPAQRERWARHPERTPVAIDEILRFVTPVNHMMRTATADAVVGGQRIREGERLILFYASANRDESLFDAPDELRVDRRPNPHLAFGVGEHFCIGSHLARKTSGSLFAELLPRLEHVELAGEPQRTASNLVPGIKRLPIRYRIRPAGTS
jgi:cytochrome P450